MYNEFHFLSSLWCPTIDLSQVWVASDTALGYSPTRRPHRGMPGTPEPSTMGGVEDRALWVYGSCNRAKITVVGKAPNAAAPGLVTRAWEDAEHGQCMS